MKMKKGRTSQWLKVNSESTCKCLDPPTALTTEGLQNIARVLWTQVGNLNDTSNNGGKADCCPNSTVLIFVDHRSELEPLKKAGNPKARTY